MSFSSIDDLVAEMAAGKTWRQDYAKTYSASNVYGAGTAAAGRWYDLTGYGQSEYVHGNYITNAHMTGGLAGWTTSSANVSWDAVNTAASKTGGAAESITQNTTCVSGTTYEVIYTIAGYTGSGNVSVSLGGTAGTNRTANGTYTENIACGATANAPLTINFPTTLSAGRVDNIIVRRLLAFTAYSDSGVGAEAGIYHGGNVSPDTKHITNIGAMANAATGVGTLYIVDLLGCYPKIATNSASVQTLNNTIAIPRYASGAGVRAFLTLNTANGANAQNFSYNYTNPTPTAGRTPFSTIANTASAVTGHMSTTGVAANNYAPFLPLAGGDAGIVSVQSAQFSAASASAGFADLVLCRPLAWLPITNAFFAAERDLLTQLPSLPRVYDGACLGLVFGAGGIIVSGNSFQGYIETAWG